MRKNNARTMAFGGVFAALAVVIMCMGTLIPVATFVCPMLCMLMLRLVLKTCGKSVAWAWYGAVALLSMLMAPDKEAGLIFACLGYYPIIKPCLDGFRFGVVLKLLFFNGVIFLLYGVMLHLLGMTELMMEYQEGGIFFTALLLVLGNVTFFMLDRLLEKKIVKRK